MPIRPIFGFWGAKFPKMGDFLPINHGANFDAVSVFLSDEVHNRTNTQTNKQ